MKMVKNLFSAVMLTATIAMVAPSCKPKDADVQTKVAEALKSTPGVTVSVTDGVATLTGEVQDEATKAAAETAAKGIADVKSVVNNLTVAAPPPPPPASMTTLLDEATQQKVKDGLKDMASVTLAGFTEKGAIINGEVTPAQNMKIKQMLASAKVMLDASSKLVIKK
ncbi:MAG: BON domain-containing protein [Chitinophagaceae bacterium]